jgi:hypothetical protein
MQLAEALLPSLAMLEVALRNSVHDTLTAYVGTDFWFKRVLHPKAYSNVVNLITELTQKHGQPPTSGKVISELTFGFWHLVFTHRYHGLWWRYPNPLLANVLPHHPGIARDTRSKFEARLDYFREVRNRAMHAEAIFQGVAALNRPLLSIDILHAQILETIAWIDGDAARILLRLDRFGDVHARGRARIEASLKAEFAIP